MYQIFLSVPDFLLVVPNLFECATPFLSGTGLPGLQYGTRSSLSVLANLIMALEMTHTRLTRGHARHFPMKHEPNGWFVSNSQTSPVRVLLTVLLFLGSVVFMTKTCDQVQVIFQNGLVSLCQLPKWSLEYYKFCT